MSFIKCILLQKSGSIKSKQLTNNLKNSTKLNLKYFIDSKQIKSSKQIIHVFTKDNYNYYFIGSQNGKEKSINKHELPPPIDNLFIYNHIFVIKTDSKKNMIDLTKKDWLDLNEETYRELLKRSPMKRAKFKGIKRNVFFVNPTVK